MQIHVVKLDDSIWKIAQIYGVSSQQIIDANKLTDPGRIVVGQVLVIPTIGTVHTVHPGESLWSISRNYGVSVNDIVQRNHIQNPDSIPVGLRLYIPKPRLTIETNAYIDPRMTGTRTGEVVDEAGEHLTYLAVFIYAVNRDGTLTPVEDQAPLNAASNHKVVPILVIGNFEAGTFSTELAATILSNDSIQDRIITEALNVMAAKGYRVLDFDFEYLGRENRERYNNFLRKASQRVRAAGYNISAALAPKLNADQVGVLYEGHDYPAVGQIVDFIFFMTYEWGWSGGPPMAVSPINQVGRVMEYAISAVPKNKIMMGIPQYGYDWTLPYVRGGTWARSITPQQAVQLAIKYNVSIQYDPTSQAPFFTYADEQGRNHTVWFEDARSIQAKFNLVKELGIRGFFFWVLRGGFPQNWLLLEDNFAVRKRL
ncbi:MAG: Spore germination protein YaaH [Candidatus Dichloromethanomonas elyunquensis]|nr:MAG: Spore germination protein YaaH [Candidatus Dichloromethanomonas elyunquensis]